MATDWENAMAMGGTALAKAEARNSKGEWTSGGTTLVERPLKDYATGGERQLAMPKGKTVKARAFDVHHGGEHVGTVSNHRGGSSVQWRYETKDQLSGRGGFSTKHEAVDTLVRLHSKKL